MVQFVLVNCTVPIKIKRQFPNTNCVLKDKKSTKLYLSILVKKHVQTYQTDQTSCETTLSAQPTKLCVAVDTTNKIVSWLAQPTKMKIVVGTTNKIVYRGWHNQQKLNQQKCCDG
jgi:hypothetical protein